ncbi:M4 family metallopeptidase [Actinopolymorpha rutila]|uniref:Zn-dependent metalloprotease n=1 Tax=Actinopolymorpha rutila TaxID=446787 RepID=A0A852ZPU2_9ACTN|nr:Zn-dependent metalloprotease [Actinopolymorpha rutila]
MKYRRTVGGIAALATVISGSALALAAPSYAGTMSGPSFLPKKPDSSIKVLEGSDGDVTGIAAKGAAIKLPKGSSESPKAAARTHLQNFAGKLGVDPAQMRTVKSQQVDGGNTVRMQQYINGIPVVAGELVASLDKQSNLEALLGKTAKGSVQTVRKQKLFTVGASRVVARDYVAKKADVSAAKLEVKSEGRWIYNPSLLGAPGAPVNRETLKFQVNTPDHSVDYTVFVDSGFHTVALAVSNNHAALKRDVCDLNNKDAGNLDGAVCDGSTNAYTRREGQAKSGIADVDKVYDNLGVVSKWYASYAGLDVSSFIGGDSKTLKASTRTCLSQLQAGCPLANAFWSDGIQQMVYGEGVTGLDVTGHELTHGVTAHTSALFYAYQSGAINESVSDTMGELIDLAANPGKAASDQGWLIGEDEKPASPDLPAPLRSLKDPTKYDQPDRMTSSLWAADAQYRDSGGVHTNSGPGNKTAYLLTQGDTFNGYTIRGIGLAKAFKIYWTAENLMTSGTDYKDLFNVLPLSCRKNIGKTGTYITEDDCAQVDKAVRATELYKDPANAAPVATPYCTVGNVKSSYVQTFDASPSDWSMAGGAGLTNADIGFDYVNTGKDALGLFTQPASGPYPAVTTSTATSSQKTIPVGSWLRIDYATLFSLYQPSAGTTAKLEYNDGSGWKNANSLPGSVNGGPWTQHDSHGWASAKYNLLTLAGKKVQFRISASGVSSDAQASVMDVDNFKIYTCA